MKEILMHCDIDKCNETNAKTRKNFDIIFTTEQTEGNTTKPYVTTQTLDVCDKCYDKLTLKGKYIQGSGAQGHNIYIL